MSAASGVGLLQKLDHLSQDSLKPEHSYSTLTNLTGHAREDGQLLQPAH